MQYSAVAFDLDGTLIGQSKNILIENIEAINKIRAQGIEVFLVTGRHHTAAYAYHQQLNLSTPIISCNGAYVFDPQHNKILFPNNIATELALSILNLAESINGLHILMYTDKAMLYQKLNQHMQSFLDWSLSCPATSRPVIQQVNNFTDIIQQDEMLIKFVISAEDIEIINKKFIPLLPKNSVNHEFSWLNRLDITAIGNTKGSALIKLLTKYQIDPQQCIAFGDNFNDISMLSNVGLAVAMGNAEDEVKQQADIVTSTNDLPGIANILKQYCLQ